MLCTQLGTTEICSGQTDKLYLELTSLRDQASINILKTLTFVKITGRTHVGSYLHTEVGVLLDESHELWHFLLGMQKNTLSKT